MKSLRVQFRRDTLLCNTGRTSFTSRLEDCSCGGTVHAICFEPRRHNFIRTLCEFQALPWHSALRFLEAKLLHTTLRLPEDTAISEPVVAPFFSIPGGRASEDPAMSVGFCRGELRQQALRLL